MKLHVRIIFASHLLSRHSHGIMLKDWLTLDACPAPPQDPPPGSLCHWQYTVLPTSQEIVEKSIYIYFFEPIIER